jgi:hypothetical protein
MAYCRPQASLLNPLRRFFPAEWHFVTKLGTQVSPFPVPIFGVNTIVSPALSVLLVVRQSVVSSAAADFAAREGMRTYYMRRGGTATATRGSSGRARRLRRKLIAGERN